MPLYSYTCCGNETEAVNRIAERRTHAPKCPDCSNPMDIKLNPVMGHVQSDCHYRCPVTDRQITTHRQRANVMAEHNLIDANDFPPEKTIAKQNAIKAKRDELAAGLHKPLIFQ
jgi:hypothetical protein